MIQPQSNAPIFNSLYSESKAAVLLGYFDLLLGISLLWMYFNFGFGLSSMD